MQYEKVNKLHDMTYAVKNYAVYMAVKNYGLKNHGCHH